MTGIENPSVVRKVRMVLDAFDARHPVIGLSELARRTGLSKTSVHRVATELVEVGLLDRHGRSYCLGAVMFELGQHVPKARSLRLPAAQYLQDLAATTRETVLLSFPGEHDVLFAEKYFSQRGGSVMVTKVEGRVPFHCGASGKALLAFGDPAIRKRVLDAPLARRTRWTINDPTKLATEIHAVRERGYAIDRRELVAEYGAVAAPVFVGGIAVATLTVVGPISRFDVRQLAPLVTAAGNGLTRDVAYLDD